MKKALIISPYFAPANAADSQRIRMSLPYFKELGWETEIVTCNPKYYDFSTDELLLKSIPKDIKIHHVKALDKKWTSKLGLGSLALRSLWFYKNKVNQILQKEKYDLIYFSTTQFPVCILGAYWKKKFGTPYVIDMQDPWHTDYYQDKPKNERPAKYWFSYRLNKYLEPLAMKHVDGLISVSEPYISELKQRYPSLINIPSKVITFGYSDIDLNIACSLSLKPAHSIYQTLTYIGVLGPMMNKSLNLFFKNIKSISFFEKDYKLLFRGTSYAPASMAQQTALPIAKYYEVSNVEEDTTRLSIFEVLASLKTANGLIIFGTDDEAYTASKLYPYLQAQKPILAILHSRSSATGILATLSNSVIIHLDLDNDRMVQTKLAVYFELIKEKSFQINSQALLHYSSQEMTKKQCELFNKIISYRILN